MKEYKLYCGKRQYYEHLVQRVASAEFFSVRWILFSIDRRPQQQLQEKKGQCGHLKETVGLHPVQW